MNPNLTIDAPVPEEWVDAGLRAAGLGSRADDDRLAVFRREQMRRALEAVVPLAELRVTRDLMEARRESEGR